MKTMLLLRGIQGSGKSTLIEKYHLKPYVVCPDDIRLIFQSPVIDAHTGEYSISQKNDRRVWKFVMERVEEKMARGEFIVIDAMNIDVSSWKPLADKYRYNIFVKNFDESLDVCLSRNASREPYKRVPEEVVRSCHERIKSSPVPSWCIPVDDMDEFLDIRPVNADRYDRLVFFGDIHGCFEPLDNYFRNHPYSENSLYVFLGDYLDRGLQNKEALEFLMRIGKNSNVKFLEGNHWWERMWSHGESEKIKSREFMEHTLPQIESVDKKEVRRFCRKWKQMIYLSFRGRRYFASHAGFGRFPSSLLFTPAIDMIKGGKYEDDIDMWYEESDTDVIQIHGHRNIYRYDALQFHKSINLNSEVEYGEPLRILEITENGMEVLLMKNSIFSEKTHEWNPCGSSVMVNTAEGRFMQKMRTSNDIVEKRLGDGISSFNFKRDVFFSGRWNEISEMARGLFLDSTTGKVIARSYRKFFNYCEGDKNSDEFLEKNLSFPVTAYRKYNGYLGMLSLDRSGEFFFASKSTDCGDFAAWFRDIFMNSTDENTRKKLSGSLSEMNCTLVFEVIDPVRNPHIIEYDRPHLVLLDAVDNSLEFSHMDYESLLKYGSCFGLEVKKREFVFNDFSSLSEFLHNSDDLHDDFHIEGYVFHDSNDYMFKFKNSYYRLWKNRRGIKERIDSGKEIDFDSLRPGDSDFARMYFCLFSSGNDKDREDYRKMSIIQIRNLYEQLSSGKRC